MTEGRIEALPEGELRLTVSLDAKNEYGDTLEFNLDIPYAIADPRVREQVVQAFEWFVEKIRNGDLPTHPSWERPEDYFVNLGPPAPPPSGDLPDF